MGVLPVTRLRVSLSDIGLPTARVHGQTPEFSVASRSRFIATVYSAVR
jgi:hypothetical protein